MSGTMATRFSRSVYRHDGPAEAGHYTNLQYVVSSFSRTVIACELSFNA